MSKHYVNETEKKHYFIVDRFLINKTHQSITFVLIVLIEKDPYFSEVYVVHLTDVWIHSIC